MTDGLIPLNRPISPEEANLILWLLNHAEKDVPGLRDQIQSLRVVSKCNCGCPTIYFAIDGNPETRIGEAIISDHYGTVDGEEVGVMLFELNGQISSLEVYSLGGRHEQFGLAAMETLRGQEGLANNAD